MILIYLRHFSRKVSKNQFTQSHMHMQRRGMKPWHSPPG